MRHNNMLPWSQIAGSSPSSNFLWRPPSTGPGTDAIVARPSGWGLPIVCVHTIQQVILHISEFLLREGHDGAASGCEVVVQISAVGGVTWHVTSAIADVVLNPRIIDASTFAEILLCQQLVLISLIHKTRERMATGTVGFKRPLALLVPLLILQDIPGCRSSPLHLILWQWRQTQIAGHWIAIGVFC